MSTQGVYYKLHVAVTSLFLKQTVSSNKKEKNHWWNIEGCLYFTL